MDRRVLRLFITFSFLIPFFICLDACVSHDLEGPVAVDCTGFKTVSYSTDIKPLINNNCAISGCHNGDNGPDRNWTDPELLHSHAQEAKRRVSLPTTAADHMPRVGSISTDQIKLIVCWAEQGAPTDN